MDGHEQEPGRSTNDAAGRAADAAGLVNSVERASPREYVAPDGPVALSNPDDPSARLDWIDPDMLEALKRRRQRDLTAARGGMQSTGGATSSPAPAGDAGTMSPTERTGVPSTVPPDTTTAGEHQGGGSGTAPRASSASATGPLATPPDSVAKRFLQAGPRYFLRDGSREMAFEDRGARMVTAHNRPAIAESMAEMALAKGWSHIRVKGHEDFRSAVWMAAAVRGIGVTGYVPDERDRASLAELMQARMTNRVEQVDAPRVPDVATVTSLPSGDRPQPAAPAVLPSRVSVDSAGWEPESAFQGELVAHGRAPYRNRTGAQMTYFATLREASGNQVTVWGADLERAMAAGGVRTGDPVHLVNFGRRRIDADVPVVGAGGDVTGTERRTIERYVWRATAGPRELQDRQSAGGPAPDDPQRVLHLGVIAEAMRAHGFSEKSVAKVQARAGEVMDRLRAQGVEVSAPRVFDPAGRTQQPRSRGRSVTPPAVPEVERMLQPATPAVPSR